VIAVSTRGVWVRAGAPYGTLSELNSTTGKTDNHRDTESQRKAKIA